MNYITSSIILIIVVTIVIGLDCFLSSKMTDIAELKGYDAKQEHIFIFCFFLGIFGYLYVLALPDVKLQNLLKSVIEKKGWGSYRKCCKRRKYCK